MVRSGSRGLSGVPGSPQVPDVRPWGGLPGAPGAPRARATKPKNSKNKKAVLLAGPFYAAEVSTLASTRPRPQLDVPPSCSPRVDHFWRSLRCHLVASSDKVRLRRRHANPKLEKWPRAAKTRKYETRKLFVCEFSRFRASALLGDVSGSPWSHTSPHL